MGGVEPLIKEPRSSHGGKLPWAFTELERGLLDMGISSALWRLSRLSWVSHSVRQWPGLYVTRWMPAEKAHFQAVHGSCQSHSEEETCWHSPATGTPPCPCSPLLATAAAAHISKGADQCHHASPHLVAPLHGRTCSSSSLFFLLLNLPKCARTAVCPAHNVSPLPYQQRGGGSTRGANPCSPNGARGGSPVSRVTGAARSRPSCFLVPSCRKHASWDLSGKEW